MKRRNPSECFLFGIMMHCTLTEGEGEREREKERCSLFPQALMALTQVSLYL